MAQRHKDSMAQWLNGKLDWFIFEQIIFAGVTIGFFLFAFESMYLCTFVL
jgi:hypothetical protein